MTLLPLIDKFPRELSQKLDSLINETNKFIVTLSGKIQIIDKKEVLSKDNGVEANNFLNKLDENLKPIYEKLDNLLSKYIDRF